MAVTKEQADALSLRCHDFEQSLKDLIRETFVEDPRYPFDSESAMVIGAVLFGTFYSFLRRVAKAPHAEIVRLMPQLLSGAKEMDEIEYGRSH